MSYAKAKALDPDAIPVIDIGALRGNTDESDLSTSVSRALHSASQNLGFIYVAGHGIDDQLITDTREAAYRFFRDSDEHKQRVLISPQHRGWLSPGAAKMSDDAKADLKESFIWGFEDKNGNTPQDHPLRGANQWPEDLPQLRKLALEYFDQAHALAFDLMRGFAMGLGLPADFFLAQVQQPMSRASFVYYPPQPESFGENHFGVAPHTDFGVMTILCQDDVGGLQVQGLDGEWIEAPPIDDTLVINVGDLLSRWTNGSYRSTPHRVVNSSGRERMSMVLAFDPDPQTRIDARDIYGEDYVASEPAITCGDYLEWRFGKAFAYRSEATTS